MFTQFQGCATGPSFVTVTAQFIYLNVQFAQLTVVDTQLSPWPCLLYTSLENLFKLFETMVIVENKIILLPGTKIKSF